MVRGKVMKRLGKDSKARDTENVCDGGGGTPFSANFFLLTFLQAAFRDGGDWGIVPPPIMVIIQ